MPADSEPAKPARAPTRPTTKSSASRSASPAGCTRTTSPLSRPDKPRSITGSPAHQAERSPPAFLDWAHTAGLIPALHIVRPPPRTSNTPIDHATRLRQARSLLDNDQIEPSTRITGTLLLLYGQLITRLVRLRTTDIQIDQDDNVHLRLGDDPIAILGPLATLLREQRERAGDSWLFPGAKPGTHIGPERIRRRLRQLGISPRTARPGALLALAVTVPAPILAELLGYHNDTTDHWRREAAGDWARYAHLASTPTT